MLHELEPACTHLLGAFRETISGQVDETALVTEFEKIDQLCPAGRSAHARERRAFRDGVDGARLARVRPACESYLAAGVGRELVRLGRARQECHVGIEGHDRLDAKYRP